jgi:rhomboid protease GluP
MVEDYVFWKLAYHFVSEENYRILHLSKEQKEIWLENLDSKQAPVIRLLNCKLDWASSIERDIQITGLNGERIRKQKFKKSLQIINVYVSPYPPVDDYEYRINEQRHFDHTTVSSILLARSTYKEAITKLQSNFTKEFILPSHESMQVSTDQIEELKKNTLEITFNMLQREQSMFTYGKPIITYLFIAVQIIIFILLEINGGSTNTSTLIKFGAKFNPLIIEGEWWRFLAPIVLHIGFMHLIMNSLGLYFLGTAVEKIYGSVRFFWIYLFAGFIGSVASFVFSPNLSAGASGAIYGCFGALLYLGMIYPKVFFRTLGKNVIVVLVLNLVISFTIPSIDYAGHIGGLVGGFIATGMVHFPKKKKLISQLLFIMLGAILSISFLYFGYNKPIQFQSEASILQLAQEYIKEEKFEQSYSLLTEYQDHSDNLTEHFYFQLSYVEIQQGMLRDAENHLNMAIELEPHFHEAHYNLALILLQLQEIEKAKEHVKKAVEISPENKDYQELSQKISDFMKNGD